MDLAAQRAVAKAKVAQKKSEPKATQKTKFVIRMNKRGSVETWAIHDQSGEKSKQVVQINVAIEHAKEEVESAVRKLNAGDMTVAEAVQAMNALKATK